MTDVYDGVIVSVIFEFTDLIRSWMSPPLLASYRTLLSFLNLMTKNIGHDRYDGLVNSSYENVNKNQYIFIFYFLKPFDLRCS